jgi:PAS domain S-box-containing protein
MTKLTFAQLVDIEQIQRMLEAHYKITGVLSAILDTDEKILVAAGWQDICTRFHRVHPGACERCRESDAYIKAHLPDFAGEYLDYKCKNGLWDVAVPIIITGEHLATFFTGQFFYDDDKPDMDFFRTQAREFGFDEESYLEALSRVPVFSREQIRNIMDFYRNLVQIMAEMGLKNLVLLQEVMERQRTEEALRASEERYTLAVQGSNDGIWDLNLVTGEAYHSSRWKSIIGYEDDEIADNFEEWESRLHPDDHQRVMDAGKAYEEGSIPAFEVEYRLRHKDGGYRWVLTRGACLRDSQGQPYRMAGSLTDITSRKLFDEERRRNEALFETVLETLPVGVWILEKNGTVALSNEAARKIWGGMHCVGIDQYDKYKAWWHDTGKRVEKEEWGGARAITGGETSLGEIIDIECLDGSRKTIVNSAVPLRNDKGEIFAAVIVNEDITDLKRTEKSLMESEKKYRAIFEESKDAILVSDTGGRPLDINQAGLELFGYTKEEYLKLDLTELYCNPEDRKLFWQKMLRSGFVNDYEVEMKRKDGEKIIIHLSVSIIKDDEGQVLGYRGLAHDVTKRKRLEHQLLQAQKMESIGLLAGGVAHDFNNLLTAISGYGQILQDSVPADDELSQESIEQVLKAAERAAELTRSLLAFSRKQVINPKPVLIGTIISNTSKLIQRIIGEDIEFSVTFSDKKLLVMADAGQIEQVLMNLATNARDAMPHGGCLSISTEQVVVKDGTEALYDLVVPGKYALISVADTGAGIDKKSIKRLFEPFYTTKEVGKGTGLGLSIVYGIIKQHDGSVLVSSEPGQGTTFNIYLPLVEGCAVKDETRISAPLAGGVETLLIAEDEEIVKLFLRKILEKAGYRVIVANDGEEAVARFKEYNDISLVLSDVVMPKKNGKEILEEIRRIKPQIKVIFISGYTADIIHAKGILEQDVDFISKPFSKNDLLLKVREVLDRR